MSFDPGAEPASLFSPSLPLSLPEELWAKLEPSTRDHYLAAQTILDFMKQKPSVDPQLLVDAIDVEPEAFVAALRLLVEMGLVSMDGGPDGSALELVALPDEHLRINGVDGRKHWLFVARPVSPPDVPYGKLN